MSGRPDGTVAIKRAPFPIPTEIDGGALIRAKRQSARCFEKVVQRYRERGATAAEIVRAMAASREMIAPNKILKGAS